MVRRKTPDLKRTIRSIPDFPKPGIVFRDITTLLQNKKAFHSSIDALYRGFKSSRIDKVVSVESRGFIFGSPLADRLGAGFVPVRKPKKLPFTVVSQSYDLEYGQDTLEIHTDAIRKNEKVLIVDDLLATGGTAAAACSLVEKLGGKVVALAFVIELSFLHGREKLKGREVFSIVKYDSE